MVVMSAKNPHNHKLYIETVGCQMNMLDSELVVKQIGGQYKVKEPRLQALHGQVIMLLNAGEEEHSQGSHIALLLGLPSLMLVGVLLTWSVMHQSTDSVRIGSLYGDPKTIGKLLFSQYLLPFEITSLLILIAIMGAVVLASKPEVTPVGLDSGLASGKEN